MYFLVNRRFEECVFKKYKDLILIQSLLCPPHHFCLALFLVGGDANMQKKKFVILTSVH
jgi:hypothetical protein